jgi:hypothetical protein
MVVSAWSEFQMMMGSRNSMIVWVQEPMNLTVFRLRHLLLLCLRLCPLRRRRRNVDIHTALKCKPKTSIPTATSRKSEERH